MNTCPFCKERFEYKDILFFASRQNLGVVRNNAAAPRSGMGLAGQDLGGRRSSLGLKNVEIGDRRSGGRMPAQAEEAQESIEKAPETAEAPEHSWMGKWARDEKYEDYRRTFWKSEASRAEERFIVRWDAEAAKPGTASVDIWNDDERKEYPMVVRLCGKDAADAGNTAPGGLVDKAMCPHCHCAIPTDYLAIPDENCHSVALIGYPSTGKTAYKLAIMDELVKNFKARFRMCQSVEVFADSVKFLKSEEGNFANGQAETTDANATVFPMIFAIRQRDSSHLITLYDLPGEAYRPQHSIQLAAHAGIQSVDAAIMLVDAGQLYEHARAAKLTVEVVDESGRVVDTKETDITYPELNTDITAPLEHLRKYRIGSSIEHMALVVTKADLLIGKYGTYFGENNPVYLKMLEICHSDESKEHEGKVNRVILNKIDAQTMKAIQEVPAYEKRDIKGEICDMLYGETLKPGNIKSFVVSTLRRPDANATSFVVSDESNYTRHRVLEPMLYLMANWGMVPVATELPPAPGPEPEPEKRKGLFGRLFGR